MYPSGALFASLEIKPCALISCCVFFVSVGIDFVDKMHKAAKELQSKYGHRPSYVLTSDNVVTTHGSTNCIPNFQ